LNKIIPLVNINSDYYKNNPKFSSEDVAEDFRYTYASRSMTFDKNLNLKGLYCYHPFNTITIDKFGDVFMCVCQAWLPISVGKIWEFDSLDDIVSSPRARELQASILDGSYRYCDHNTCGIIKNKDLKRTISHRPDTVNWINFSIDSSCNLTCPSCRTEFKFISEGADYDNRLKIVDHIIKLIEQHNHWLKFTLAGDGDPFASLIYRHLMSNLNIQGKQIEIEIVTNGLLCKAHWHKLSGIHKNLVRTKISFDAGTESVYNITRRGGDWNKLLESCRYLVKWKQKTYSDMTLTANFVVQTANYRDMPAYVELCDKLGFDEIHFQKITDWGTFANFQEQAIWQQSHPMHDDYLHTLQHPLLNNKKINFTNLQ